MNQVTGFRANLDKFKAMDVEILQISADTVPSLKAWSESLGNIPFPLLSDYWPHGAIGRAYGVFNEERGMDARAVFLVDAKGVQTRKTVITGLQGDDSTEIVSGLKEGDQVVTASISSAPMRIGFVSVSDVSSKSARY